MLLRNKKEIEEWLNKYHIKNYELIADDKYGYVVNVDSNVDLTGDDLKSIDVKFNIIKGYFDCSCNRLQSLVGCPEIVNGTFYCYYNNLKSLDGCPKLVKGNLWCNNNELNMEGLKYLINSEIKDNYINLNGNKELVEFQEMNNVEEIKKILTIYQEKAGLMKILEVTNKSVESTDKSVENLDLIINNKSIKSNNIVSTIEKINKI